MGGKLGKITTEALLDASAAVAKGSAPDYMEFDILSLDPLLAIQMVGEPVYLECLKAACEAQETESRPKRVVSVDFKKKSITLK